MKLSPLPIIFIGIAVALVAFFVAFFLFFQPNRQEARFYRDLAQQLEVEARKLPQAEQRVRNAVDRVEELDAEWQDIAARRTPPQSVEGGGINLAVNRYQLSVDALRFRNNVQRAVNAQMRRGGVTVVQGVQVPQPPEDPDGVVEAYFNFPGAAQTPVAIFDLGTVTVRGTYNQIRENVRSWTNMPNYLAVVDGLSISGTEPELFATYNVQLVAFIRGDRVAAPVGAGAAAAAAGVAGGGGFGGPGGPGGPPGGFPPTGAANVGGGGGPAAAGVDF